VHVFAAVVQEPATGTQSKASETDAGPVVNRSTPTTMSTLRPLFRTPPQVPPRIYRVAIGPTWKGCPSHDDQRKSRCMCMCPTFNSRVILPPTDDALHLEGERTMGGATTKNSSPMLAIINRGWAGARADTDRAPLNMCCTQEAQFTTGRNAAALVNPGNARFCSCHLLPWLPTEPAT